MGAVSAPGMCRLPPKGLGRESTNKSLLELKFQLYFSFLKLLQYLNIMQATAVFDHNPISLNAKTKNTQTLSEKCVTCPELL
jgi:hypothetical protein